MDEAQRERGAKNKRNAGNNKQNTKLTQVMSDMACEMVLAGHTQAWDYPIDVFLASYDSTVKILKERQKEEK